MKNFVVFGAICLVILGIIFSKTYTSSPGFTTREMYEEFKKSKPTCYGLSIPLNYEETLHDAPARNLCIGVLKTRREI